jgi:hypothetical protein
MEFKKGKKKRKDKKKKSTLVMESQIMTTFLAIIYCTTHVKNKILRED